MSSWIQIANRLLRFIREKMYLQRVSCKCMSIECDHIKKQFK